MGQVRLSALDRQVLDVLQQEVPLTPAPFSGIAARLSVSEGEVLQTVRRLTDVHRTIRQISAIFDTRALGYRSTLVAARCPEDHVDAAAEVVNTHPGVSHNYRRNHAFNLWYTLAVPPTSRLGLQATVERLHELSGAVTTRRLDTLKLYKIGVQLDVTGAREPDAQTDPPAYTEEDRRQAGRHPLTDDDIRMIRALQSHLPLESRPFDRLAEQAGCSTDALLDAARRFLARGQMRRFAAVLHHREAGFAANVMGVWQVPADRADAVGAVMAGFDAVSHCYLRPIYPDWPYNIFTMVHGRTRAACIAVLDAMSRATSIPDRCDLWSVTQYKKVRVQYFTPEHETWEARYGRS